MLLPNEQQQWMMQQQGLLAPQQPQPQQGGVAGFLGSPFAYALGAGISGASARGSNYKPFGQGMSEGMKQLQEMRGDPYKQMQMQALMQEMQEKQTKSMQQQQMQQEFEQFMGGQMPQGAPTTSQEALTNAAQMMPGSVQSQGQGMPAQTQQPNMTQDPARRQAAKILMMSGDAGKAMEMLVPKPKEPFTIGEGQGYYDANGKLIVERGKSTTLSPGQVYVDSAGKEIARGLADTEKTFNNATALRKEYTSLSGEYIKVRDAYGRIQAAGKNPSAAGDLALIFNYMKMLDPGSTVREGEFANAQNSAGAPEWLRAKYNNFIRGERLSPNTRADFMGRSSMLYDSAQNGQVQLEGTYKDLATRNNLDPANVTLDFKYKTKEEPKQGQTQQQKQMPYTQAQMKTFSPQQWETFISQAVQGGKWTRQQAEAKAREIRGH